MVQASFELSDRFDIYRTLEIENIFILNINNRRAATMDSKKNSPKQNDGLKSVKRWIEQSWVYFQLKAKNKISSSRT